MNQNERLDYLIEAFKEDSGEYRNLKVPVDTDGKKRILRSLMNIRMPREINTEVLKIQDEYLREAINESGIVNISDIDKAEDSISIWQGDITRLKVDAIVNAANSQMLGCFIPMHSCIDNCIHTFAGVELRNECNKKMNRLKICYGRDYEQPTAIPMRTLSHCLICAHVHDELTIECRKDVSFAAICEQMGRTPPWAEGLVLDADGYEIVFYKKL